MRVAVVVISSKIASGDEPDEGREAIAQMVQDLPATMVAYEVVPDERSKIRSQLITLCADRADVILTLGGTGVRPTDWTPEATRDVIEKEVPGIGEAMRSESLKKVRTAMLSRGTVGIRGRTLIVNLPGSLKGAKENLAVVQPVLEHLVEKIQKV
ncbi:MAG: MogA/MoaB family molybdenum cofactor biosynthesis protein [Nitrospira sp.]|nr:MogA/MoaB family molybdenum cofactor biosynthesis protein [Nitrospira sp.]